MSAEGQIYVEKYSPYTGNTYAVHLRLGLLSNDAHGYQIYSGDKYLAQKCRCSVESVKRAKAVLIRDGFLKPLFPAVGRRFAEYEFIFKGQGIAGQQAPPNRMAGHPSMNSGSSAKISPINRNELKETPNPSISEPVDLAAVRARRQRIMPSFGKVPD